MKIRLYVVAAVALFAFVPTLQASVTPEEIVEQYYKHMMENNWDIAAILMHPDALDDLRDLMLPVFEHEPSGDFIQYIFGGGTTLEDVQNLSGPMFFADIMRFFMDDMPMLLKFESLDILGSVPEGPDVAHVVVRSRVHMEEIEITLTQMTVISLHTHEDGWGLMLSGEIEGMAQALNAAFGME